MCERVILCHINALCSCIVCDYDKANVLHWNNYLNPTFLKNIVWIKSVAKPFGGLSTKNFCFWGVKFKMFTGKSINKNKSVQIKWMFNTCFYLRPIFSWVLPLIPMIQGRESDKEENNSSFNAWKI